MEFWASMAGSSRAGYGQKAINRWAARIIPAILIGIMGYASWVMVELVCVNYLLRPSASASTHLPRSRSAIAVLVVYSILLLLLGITYTRLLYTVATNPGYVERGPQWHEKNEAVANRNDVGSGAVRLRGHDLRRPRRRGAETSTTRHPRDGPRKPSERVSDIKNRHDSHLETFDYMAQSAVSRPTAADEASRDLQEHYTKEVFVCEGDGRPTWCSSCMNWKPDRAHHCREVDRCVRKMDHFCPWVAGVVGETTFKFFIQFTSWAAIYCIFIVVIMGIVIAEARKEGRVPNIHWIVTISLAALFTLFGAGMSGSSLQFAFLNTTTIENLTRHSKVWQLAFYMARPPSSQNGIGFPSVTYPLGDGTSTAQSSSPKRTFMIRHSKPGESPWDLGPFANFKSVMGVHWYDWLMPLRHSPCCDHSRGESQFELGEVVERMRAEAGLIPLRDPSLKPRSRWGQDRARRSREGEVKNASAPQSRVERMRTSRGQDDATSHGEPDAGIELSETNANRNVA